MSDVHTTEQRSRNMAAIRGRGNKSTEVALAKIFRRNGITGWQRHYRRFPGLPDFTFAKHKIVVFVDGCFWHGCKIHYKSPSTRRKFWSDKITKNKQRDRKISAYYKQKGWKVLRIWEHQIKKNKRFIKNLSESIGRN
ncbi:MAG: very short patch repair endonuclease [Elusimicrobia bacterium]|nr:very short patch repair endonuclease [Elusimicrobiota bacterium]